MRSLCVHWYLRYPLSYRNLEEMMAERGLAVDLWFPGNPDLVHTLGVELHPFCHPSFYVDGRSDSSAGFPSHSGRSSDGGARSSPSTQRFAALGEATQADRWGSILASNRFSR
jgi:hypothetical protein